MNVHDYVISYYQKPKFTSLLLWTDVSRYDILGYVEAYLRLPFGHCDKVHVYF